VSLLGPAAAADAASAAHPPGDAAKSIASGRFDVAPDAALPYAGTVSLDAGDRRAVRAVIVVHGARRNAEAYEASIEAALRSAQTGDTTVAVAPQFLSETDASAHDLPGSVLRWHQNEWDEGAPSLLPAAVSSFAVLDALVARLSDRSHFPALREIVVAGFSAGGQMVQRYAVVGDAPRRAAGLRVRFIVADPSSYLYFDGRRPLPGGGFAPFAAASCPSFDAWKYGPDSPPAYVTAAVTSYEAAYVQRDVTYLIGTADDDPQQAALDRSCAGEAQGPNRVARARAYVAYLHARHPAGTNQTFAESQGIAHDQRAMFNSPCGAAVLLGASRRSCVRSGAV
jgi:hypothetical protein